jgi:hypothetical protein
VTILYLLLVNLAGLALTIAGIVRSGDRPQVLLYAFILDYLPAARRCRRSQRD